MARTVDSLLSITIRKICNEFTKFVETSADTLRMLPDNVKDIFLRKLTRRTILMRIVEPCGVLSLLIHKSLVTIDLSRVRISDELLDMLEPCTKLQSVSFSGNKVQNPTAQAMCRFLRNKRRLRILQISHCNTVTDEVVKVVAESCPDLNGLVLRWCSSISDEALVSLASLNHLTWLDFSGTSVTDDGVSALSRGNSKEKILELRIAYCPLITFRVLSVVVENCVNMEVLEFHNCFQSPEHLELASLEASKMKRLKQLSFTVNW